ncbi:hypothetical protein D3C87_1315960 [compost metagenome]
MCSASKKLLPNFGSMARALCIDAGSIVESPAAPDNRSDFLINSLLDSIIVVCVFKVLWLNKISNFTI